MIWIKRLKKIEEKEEREREKLSERKGPRKLRPSLVVVAYFYNQKYIFLKIITNNLKYEVLFTPSYRNVLIFEKTYA
jgi:hypothetical protein